MNDSARYFVATALGLAGGAFMANRLHRHGEFTADALGAKLTSPEAMKAALQDIRAHSRKIWGQLEQEQVIPKLESLKQTIDDLIFSHPSDAERIARIERLPKQAAAALG